MMDQIQLSKNWLLTSPHEEEVNRDWNKVSNLCFMDTHIEVVMNQSQYCGQAMEWLERYQDIIFDYALGYEEGNHVHLAVRFRSEMPPCFTELIGWNVQAVPDNLTDDAFDYAKKSGVYVHKMEEIPEPYDTIPVWSAWQRRVINILKNQDHREILFVYDPKGATGKTFLSMWFAHRRRAQRIPAIMKSAQDIVRMVHGCPSSCYFIDMPRAITKTNQRTVFSALETIKDGFAYDDRYQYKQRLYSPPSVCVFANWLPDTKLLSSDRWTIVDLANGLINTGDGDFVEFPRGE